LAVVVAHGSDYLSVEEYGPCLKDAERRYFLYLSRCRLRGRNSEFWDFHRNLLASINYAFDWRLLAKWIPRALVEKTWESFWARWDKRSFLNPEGEVAIPAQSALDKVKEDEGETVA